MTFVILLILSKINYGFLKLILVFFMIQRRCYHDNTMVTPLYMVPNNALYLWYSRIFLLSKYTYKNKPLSLASCTPLQNAIKFSKVTWQVWIAFVKKTVQEQFERVHKGWSKQHFIRKEKHRNTLHPFSASMLEYLVFKTLRVQRPHEFISSTMIQLHHEMHKTQICRCTVDISMT